MKTEISYRTTQGTSGVTIVNGNVHSALDAKHALAKALDLPAGDSSDIDDRLRVGGVEPASVTTNAISE